MLVMRMKEGRNLYQKLNSFLHTQKFYSASAISKIKMMDPDKCYFRYIEKENKIGITFMVKLNESIRQFNLSRKPEESLQTLICRISANMQKAVAKTSKKKSNNEQHEMEIMFYDNKNEIIPIQSTCQELFSYQGPIHFNINKQKYEVVFNAPWVINISLPQSILAGFPVYPEKFTTYFTNKLETVFKWYTGSAINENGKEIADIHIKWIEMWSGFSYTPSSQDIGFKLKLVCIPGNEVTTGPAVETISKNVVEAGPGPCPFETRHTFTSCLATGKSFRCVSYNILADLYCDSDFTRTSLYPYCPPYALHVDYRKQLIMKELLGYNADIICLQEVDKKIFYNCLEPFFEAEGINGVFHKKGKEVAEGLACFYRTSKFRLMREKSVVMSEAVQTEACLSSIWNAIEANQQFKERLLNRSNVISVVILESIDNENEILLVGNTHLYFHPDADHIRVVQGGIAIYWLKEIRNTLIKENPDKRVSLILCGDFNSVPSCGIYQLYTTGVASAELPDWKSNEIEALTNISLLQDIPLASACGTPKYTNFTEGFADCLDYIYYEKSNLTVEQVVPFPSEEELRTHTALPSIVFPSDHIALITDLSFT